MRAAGQRPGQLLGGFGKAFILEGHFPWGERARMVLFAAPCGVQRDAVRSGVEVGVLVAVLLAPCRLRVPKRTPALLFLGSRYRVLVFGGRNEQMGKARSRAGCGGRGVGMSCQIRRVKISSCKCAREKGGEGRG